MTITEFARSRNEQVNTVSKYIREHQEFKGHTSRKGKNVVLDDVALDLLDKKYPLPKPVTVINGIPEEEHYKMIQEKDEQIQGLQDKLISLQETQSQLMLELGELRSKALLLEDKERENERLTSELDRVMKRGFLDRLFNR